MLNRSDLLKSRRIKLLSGLIIALLAPGIISLTQANSQPIPLPSAVPAIAPEATDEIDFSAYDPAKFGIPETLAGYTVIAVLSSDNTECVPSGFHRVVVQAPQPTVDEYLKSDALTSVQAEMNELGKSMASDWVIQFVGPALKKEEFLAEISRWNSQIKVTECHQSQPISTSEED